MGFFLKSDKPAAGGINTDPQKIDALLSRGVTEAIDKEELKKLLLSGKQLRIKLGIDPTSPNVHLGRAVTLLKLRDFQELGHQLVFIIGDFTGVIGDTSDKDSERPMLRKETIEENLKNYREQAGKILNISKVEVRRNSEWLGKLTFSDIGEIADRFSVADFIARENIKKRLDAGTRVSLREVLYPLMQGYDSVAVKADVEIGGTDQRFNLLAGRTLQPLFKQPSQQILMTGLIRGLDGRKMSSSWGNTINLLDAPNDMYGKVMSAADDLMEEYFVYTTRVPMDEVTKLVEALKSGSQHPKEIKMRLAREIVSMYYGKDAAEKAEANFTNTFEKGGVPDDAPEVSLSKGDDIADALKNAGVVASVSEWRRLIDEGAVEEMGGEPFAQYRIPAEKDMVLKIGKRRFAKIKIK
jgi:tyrosyl-tRNA synthetase